MILVAAYADIIYLYDNIYTLIYVEQSNKL